jgi:uncharacterized protein
MKKKNALLVMAGSLSVVIALSATTRQSSAAAAGHWEGTIQVPGESLTVAVDLAQQNGAWVGTITIPAQGVKGFALSPLTVDGNSVTFGMKGIPGDPLFKGTVSGEPRSLSGEFTQATATLPFTLTWKGEPQIDTPQASTAITNDLEGAWEGSLNVQGKILHLVLNLANEGERAVGTLTSVDQGGAKIPIAQVSQHDAALTLLVSAIGAGYEGTLANGELSGTWSQAGQKFPLVFKRTQK